MGSAVRDHRTVCTKVFFRWADCTRQDEEVRVTGGCPELGNWDPEIGVSLVKAKGEEVEGSICWVSQSGVLLPLGCQVEYKYVVCDRTSGNFLRWESRSENRRAVPTGPRYLLEDDGGRLRRLRPRLECWRPSKLSLRKEEGHQPAGLPPPLASPAILASPIPLPSPEMSPAVGRPQTVSGLKARGDEALQHATDTIVIVFRTLPVRVEQEASTGEWKVIDESSVEIDGEVLKTLRLCTQPAACEQLPQNVKFVGLPGVNVPDEAGRHQVTQLLARHSCIPVFADEDVISEHLAFSMSFLWPVFHNMKVFDLASWQGSWPTSENTEHAFDESRWNRFQELNKVFAEAIEASVPPETVVWVHDYKLLLVPRYMRLLQPCRPIAFFLHCAFPGYEVLRCLPNRQEILLGLVSSDLVTFQVFDYMRNFIVSCTSLLGARHSFLKGGFLQLEHDGSSVMVNVDHFVIPYKQVSELVNGPAVHDFCDTLRRRFQNKVIVGSYDKCDRFEGLTLKLHAFHQFLSECPDWRGGIVLVQYVSTSTDHSIEDTASLLQHLEQMAAETNQAFGKPGDPPPVTICADTLDQHGRLGLLQATDVLLDTSINDGLNLMPFLFYAAHAQDRNGAVILSEFCGCSRLLTGAFVVNPWSPSDVVQALDQALRALSPAADSPERFSGDHSYVQTQKVSLWVDENMAALRAALQLCRWSTRERRFAVGLGIQEGGYEHLNIETVLEDYRRAKTRVLFFDNEGTMALKAAWESKNSTRMAWLKQVAPPSEQALDSLQKLAIDRGNTVVVISGRDPKTVEGCFGQVTDLGLFAEHGFYWVLPGSLQRAGTEARGEGLQWESMVQSSEDEWKEVVSELMSQYVKRVQGSIVEVKDSAITWNYRPCGARMMLNSLALELERFLDPDNPRSILYGFPVKVISGKGYIEVKRRDVDKGKAVRQVLQEMERRGLAPEFVLCVGDDRSDEDMFQVINELFPDTPGSPSPPPSPPPSPVVHRASASAADPLDGLRDSRSVPSMRGLAASLAAGPRSLRSRGSLGEAPITNCYTITVGRKPSKAKYYLTNVDEVSELLNKLSAQTVASSFSRFVSSPANFSDEAAEVDRPLRRCLTF